jgi:hypothetical protein
MKKGGGEGAKKKRLRVVTDHEPHNRLRTKLKSKEKFQFLNAVVMTDIVAQGFNPG